MPTTLTEIETALAAAWTGKQLLVLDDIANAPVLKPVQVFVDAPDVEEYEQRQYPSISIQFAGMGEDPESLDSEDEREVNYNDAQIPHLRTMRRAPIYYRIAFAVHAWSLDAAADRELIRWIDSRFRTKDALVLEPGKSYWIFRVGSTEVADEQDNDRKIYHKVLTFEVLADIENEDTDQTTPVVHTVQTRLSLVKTLTKQGVQTPVDSQNTKTTAENAVKFIDFAFAFNDSEFWIP